MQRLDAYVAQRHALSTRYDQLLAALPVTTPWQHPDCYSGLHLYVIRLQLGNIQKTHRQVFEALRDQGIGVNLHYIPVYMQPYFERMGYSHEAYLSANCYYKEAISLPMYQTLSEAEQDMVIVSLKKALRA